MFETGKTQETNPENPQMGPSGETAPATSAHSFLAGFANLIAGTTSEQLTERQLADRIESAEQVKTCLAALQARDTTALHAAAVHRHADNGVNKTSRGRGTGTEIALARSESPLEGSRHLAGSRILCADMPLTLSRFTFGALSENRAMLIAHEASALAPEYRQWVDVELNANPEDFLGESLKALGNRVRALVQEIDPATAAERIDDARAKRYIRFIPTGNMTMRIIGEIPAEQAVLMHQVLSDLADTALATGAANGRTREQIRTDEFCGLLTGETNITPPVEINLVMTDRTLFQSDAEPAYLQGYGTIPACLARQLIRGRDTDLKLKRWIRRLYTEPDTGKLLAMDSRRRTYPAGLVHWVQIRDQICATPGCENRVRHTDHIDQWFRGGQTTADNASARCAWCNQTKEYPGWKETPAHGTRHGLRITTPAGKTYHSTAPPLPGTRTTTCDTPC
ncbi:DUF222 domain-containing protein [Paeniglutamicibacter cryotolerans]|uniref:Putative cupin superfamily protein n=1 Tax=Paeniglutamicibacter cryotolerans TaxID=670079 RepID=A0A839QGM2_9MICC|nr:DUF222 domain-containing protein [Paeniglutamicibacter cryotolerans]MBB2993864.1 putative cupin superfamily protein [Paeniglutamicibacter cryotolerans]